MAIGSDDRGIVVQARQRTSFLFLRSVQTGSGAHLASYPMGSWGYFVGVKVAMKLTTTQLHLMMS
jgi:hypothetical protein